MSKKPANTNPDLERRSDGRRVHGYAPLRDYACIGDGRTVALVARDGSVDWWPLPRLDSPPAVAAILDPEHGGHLTLAPDQPYTVERAYMPDTNVLVTTYTTDRGQVRVTDAMNVGAAGLLPWAELVRRIEGIDGKVPMTWSIESGNRFGTASAWTQFEGGGPVVHLDDEMIGVRLLDAGKPELTLRGAHGRFQTEPGSRSVVAFVATADEPLFLPEAEDADDRLDRTIESWKSWTGEFKWDDDRRAVALRSALALKLLINSPNGAITAAATTSLPERIGGPKNWDYRYAWIRDLSFTVDALMRAKLNEEAHQAVSWLLHAIKLNGTDLKVFYSLDGETGTSTTELPVPGYRQSQPVRAGNGAAGQTQLGTYGYLFDTMWTYLQRGHTLGTSTARLLTDLADNCCDEWHKQDSGIWELSEKRHYTMSKIGCWSALDCAVRLAEFGQLPRGHQDRWSRERDAIRDWIDDHCWSQTKRSYTLAAGTDDLDASVVLAARIGFDRGERLAGTIDAVRSELGAGPDSPLIYRYTGMQQEEGAFLACSFWLIEALVYLGRRDEAAALFEQMLPWSTDVGLFTEQADPDGTLLGNLPQALSHLAVIMAAAALGAD